MKQEKLALITRGNSLDIHSTSTVNGAEYSAYLLSITQDGLLKRIDMVRQRRTNFIVEEGVDKVIVL